MRKVLTLCLAVFFCGGLNSQSPAIYGIISDDQNGEVLPGVVVYDTMNGSTAISNANGYFCLVAANGANVLQITVPGYATQVIKVSVFKPEVRDISMRRLSEGDFISNAAPNSVLNDYRIGQIKPLSSQISKMPCILNEQDPVKFLQFLPGVKGGMEGLSGLYVRGGNNDQNLMLMDGVPIFGSGHTYGIFSFYQMNSLRDAQFFRGPLPASYGGRGSSVVDVNTKEGNRQQWSGESGWNLVTLTANANGPLNNSGKTTMNFGIRKTWLDLLLGPKSGLDIGFYDINSKIVFRPTEHSKLSVWVFNARDIYGFGITDSAAPDSTSKNYRISEISSKTKWNSTAVGVNYFTRITGKIYANFIAGYSHYKSRRAYELHQTIYDSLKLNILNKGDLKYNANNTINLITLKAQFEQTLGTAYRLNYGLESNIYKISPYSEYLYVKNDSSLANITEGGAANISTPLENSAYGEFIAEPRKGITVSTGLRLWSFKSVDKFFFKPEPRIFIRYLLSEVSSVRLGFSSVNQGINQLSSINIPQPGDAFFPSSKNTPPLRVNHWSVGTGRKLKRNWVLSMETYLKQFKNVYDVYSGIEDLTTFQYWNNQIGQGKGLSYGAEAILSKQYGPVTGFIAYSISKTNRTIENINFGNTYPFRWDRRHVFNGIFYFAPASNLKLSTSFVIMSGSAVTVPTSAYYNVDKDLILNYTEKNNYRLPVYYRLDLSFIKETRRSAPGFRRYWGMNFYNILFHRNVMYISVEKMDNQAGYHVLGKSLFTFLPSFFFRWEF